MNQEQIGKFIAELRNNKKMTQKELATKLGVTDRAVSKWENGRGLPDLSLLKPLCDNLDISINELLSGEKLNKKEYHEKLEENIIKTINYSDKKIKKVKKKLNIFLIIILAIISIIIIDTLQARLFKNSPIISWKESQIDADSWVDRGLILDTYYCTKEQDIVEVHWYFKGTKFTCPIDNIKQLEIAPTLSPLSTDITVEIKEGTLSDTGATIIITDLTGKDNTYGESYRIDRKENDTWYIEDVIVKGNYGFTSIGYSVDEHNKLEIKYEWEWLYGSLPSGTYRIVSYYIDENIESQYFTVIFTID